MHRSWSSEVLFHVLPVIENWMNTTDRAYFAMAFRLWNASRSPIFQTPGKNVIINILFVPHFFFCFFVLLKISCFFLFFFTMADTEIICSSALAFMPLC